MLELELPEPEFTAAQWREQDERHACASCQHCNGSHISGYHCEEIERALEENGLPAGLYKLESLERICGSYQCDYEQFKRNEWEYPKGYDAAELYTDPDGKYYEEREYA